MEDLSPIWGCVKGIGLLSLSTWFCEGLEEDFAFLACLEQEDDLEVAGRSAAFPCADGLPDGESCRVHGAATQAPGPVWGERAGHRRRQRHRSASGQGVCEARSQEGEHGCEGSSHLLLCSAPEPSTQMLTAFSLGGIDGITLERGDGALIF